MEEMNEDTIEVLLFEDLDTIHRIGLRYRKRGCTLA